MSSPPFLVDGIILNETGRVVWDTTASRKDQEEMPPAGIELAHAV
jgi:hypothetical protein